MNEGVGFISIWIQKCANSFSMSMGKKKPTQRTTGNKPMILLALLIRKGTRRDNYINVLLYFGGVGVQRGNIRSFSS